ncbi:MAG: hypothetical protein D6768_01935 [Chloroflexi bacterium]|nr:MAG: hypothetical protein D6768_01935 [Chloroflexota bacterium]
MEPSQLASQLNLLEQKNQQVQATIAKLQQKIEAQEYAAQEQAHRIRQLEAELAQTQSQLAQAAQVDDKLAHLKDEILHLVERKTRGGSDPEVVGQNQALLLKQLDNHTVAINDVRREVQKIERFEEQVSLARTEATRLNQELSKVQAKLESVSRAVDERTAPIKLLEEQRRADMRKLAEMQAELPELSKKVAANTTKLQLTADQMPQYAKYEAALQSLRDEIRNYREHMDFQLAQRERQLKDWVGKAEHGERRIREVEVAMEKYTEFYQLNKRALTSLQDFQERLQRDQHRFGELQRLAEERQRSTLDKFQSEFEQRWQKQSMEMQPQFTDFQRSIQSLQTRVEELGKLHAAVETQLNIALQIIEEDIQTRAAAAADWQRRFEEIAEGQA